MCLHMVNLFRYGKICFTCGNMCLSAALSICPTLTFPWCVYKSVLCVWIPIPALFINTIFLDSVYMCVCVFIWYLLFWLTSLCIIGSWFIYLTRTDSNLFLFMAGLVFHCVYVPQLLYPFIYGSTNTPPHVLAIVNNAAMNIGIHVSLSTMILSRYVLSSGIVG